MGQYYRFRNWVTGESRTDVPFVGFTNWTNNGGLTWMPKIHQWSQDQLAELFEYVSIQTGWPIEQIEAVGDSGYRFYFDEGYYQPGTQLKTNDPIVIELWGDYE
ncbi:hypothetical protein Lepto7375DRAFT_7186 [Leptolyngbya sp. PCC 7375]|nr:hypothetical protein Lepto7375DRAFT_7186 [Leptolyngbya sp. PCC 7375]